MPRKGVRQVLAGRRGRWIAGGVIVLSALLALWAWADSKLKRVETDKTYRPDGTLWTEVEYGVFYSGRRLQHGTERLYFENGQVLHETQYERGKEHGASRWYNDDGQMSTETHYVRGKRHGKYTKWYFDEQKEAEGTYEDGLKVGIWREWHWGGDLASECTYQRGRIVGTKTWWDRGKKYREDEYDEEGNIAHTVASYSMAGGRWYEGWYRKGKKHGTWTYWNPDGTFKARGEWRDGEPWNGICQVTVPKMSLSSATIWGEYRNGRLIQQLVGSTLKPKPPE